MPGIIHTVGRAVMASLLLAAAGTTARAQESTVYATVVSTKLFVVGAANPRTGLHFQTTGGDTLAQKSTVYATAIPVWLFWPVGSHGLSGVVYGLLGYLLLIGWLERRIDSLVLSLLVLLMYGGVLPTLLPIFSSPGISWIGHASGFVGGLLAAWGMARDRKPEPRR